MDETTPPPIQNTNGFHFKSHKLFLFLCFFIVGLLVGIFFARLAPRTQQSITVIGRATQTVKADKATMTATTFVTAINASQAKAANEKLLNEIKAQLKQYGVTEKHFKVTDTHTTDYSGYVNPSPVFTCMGNAPCSGGSAYYNVSTDFKIDFDKTNISAVNAISDMLTSEGVYPTVAFNVAEREAVALKNKEKAIADAKAQAESLAKTNNEKLKKIVGIKELLSQQDGENASFSSDPTIDSAYEDIPFTSSFEVTYELSSSLF